MSGSLQRVLTYARAELGKTESPAGSNRTPYGKWYGLDGQPWCMMFVQWVFAQAGNPLPFRTASCSALLNWYQANQPNAVALKPHAGDIVIYTFGHTGIVESASGSTFTAVEGNTSPDAAGSQSNGGMVCRKTRKLYTAKAFIRPDYTEKEVPKMDNIPSPAHEQGVQWAVQNGILNGNQQGDLMLARPVTRQQLCTILYNYHREFGKEK